MKSLIINEIFYSIQGESLNTGQPTVFVRLTGCPLRCNYCDTEYAFNEGRKIIFDDIFKIIDDYKCKNITITGGEPLAQKNIHQFMQKLCDSKYIVSIETSNALDIKLIDNRVTIILDIKTPGSKEHNKNLSDNYKFLKKKDQIKFVICNIEDYEWSKAYIEEYKLTTICTILFSPSSNEMNPQMLAEKMLSDRINARLQLQIHKYIWGNIRGK
ncbi:MAG: 7-carboxy-7-deazaguanine synthase QueE [Gammaproteobacteria bacterium]|nr:7-carboxy-7-deazaguanine synthase QueE [Gammaproteobacteria bacterium]